MYIGIGPENGKRVPERDAFEYACGRVLIGDEEEQEVFMELARECSSIQELASRVTEWYFSGNWIRDPKDNKKTGWIIRFSDNSLQAFFGTYLEAVGKAKEMSRENGMGFVVN